MSKIRIGENMLESLFEFINLVKEQQNQVPEYKFFILSQNEWECRDIWDLLKRKSTVEFLKDILKWDVAWVGIEAKKIENDGMSWGKICLITWE